MSQDTSIKKQSKFSLIELLMLIMIVGIVFTLIIPLRSDRINKSKLSEGIKNVQIIARENVKFYEQPENGYYAFDLSMLDLKGKLEKTDGDFLFDYSLTDSTVVATTNDNFGQAGAEFFYYLPRGPFQLSEDSVSKETFDQNWLP
jgi:competence protein ComGC